MTFSDHLRTIILVKQPVLQVNVDKPVPEWQTIPDVNAATVVEMTMVQSGPYRRAKLQSDHHQLNTSTQIFTGQMPFLSPNQQSKQ